MINAIITGIFNLVISLVNILLYPIDYVITSTLPGLANAFSLVNNFFTKLTEVIPFVLSYSGLTQSTLTIIIDLSIFLLSAPIVIQTVKVAIKWYQAIKL